MKKALLVMCMLLSAVMTFAQEETKKVAILEVVDREGKVSYANKLILRSNLAKAITNTPGYEAYDRTDMDAILGEQNFQRTGMVSNDQIRRLGEMTGAQYVLVAEAVVVDANTMYITAKLLDVVTARTEMTDNQMMGISAKDIQRGCQMLASNLIKQEIDTKAVKHVVESVTKTTKKEKTTDSHVQQMQSVYSNELITKISGNEYRLGNTVMDRKAYADFLYKNCPAAWKKYKHGRNAVITGWTFFAVGAALQGCWGLLPYAESFYTKDKNYYYFLQDLTLGLGFGGVGLAGIGFFTFVSGYGSTAAALKTYNKRCASSTPITFNLTAGQNGLGIAMQF